MNTKKILSLCLGALLWVQSVPVLSQATPNAMSSAKSMEIIRQEGAQMLRDQRVKQTAQRLEKKGTSLATPANVRVIVELTQEPLLEVMAAQGKSFDEAPEAQRINLRRQVVSQQEKVQKALSQKGMKVEVLKSFDTALNGFSALIAENQIEVLAKEPGVKAVYRANEFHRPEATINMTSSHKMVGADTVWNRTGYRGEGTCVAVLDTGVDVAHEAMVLSHANRAHWTEAKVSALGLRGKYYTPKVPYGYNYYDKNDVIKDSSLFASQHGMHVSGTVGANGPDLKGVAPETQILGLKIFSNDPSNGSTFSDIYIDAIDDALKIGVDSINMSIGSPAGTYYQNSMEDLMFRRIREAGIGIAVAAGNSGSVEYGHPDLPWYVNPDTAMVENPGLNKDTTCVASVTNDYRRMSILRIEGKDYALSNSNGELFFHKAFGENEVEVINAGYGSEGELPQKQAAKDKILLIQRDGNETLQTKIDRALKCSPAGIILRGRDHENGMRIGSVPKSIKIPVAVISGPTGLLLAQKLRASFPEGVLMGLNEMGSTPSSFSAWGVTPGFDLKPELAAPGGDIYSTMNDNKYAYMSGTSMATPHVAGAYAVLSQYLKADPKFKTLSGKERGDLMKTLFMNTAVQVSDVVAQGEEFVKKLSSPRKQGAGMVNLAQATTTPATLVQKDTQEAKYLLPRNEVKKFTTTLEVRNYGKQELTYKVQGQVLREETKDTLFERKNFNADGESEKRRLTIPAFTHFSVPIAATTTTDQPEDFVRVGPGETKSFEVTVDFSKESLFRNQFVEGFIQLQPVEKNIPQLSLPFVTFYGNWSDLMNVDGFPNEIVRDEDLANMPQNVHPQTKTACSGLFYLDSERSRKESEGDYDVEYWMGHGTYNEVQVPQTWVSPYRGAFDQPSADGTFIGGFTDVKAEISLRRNLSVLKLDVLDAQKKVIRTLHTAKGLTKYFFNRGRVNSAFRSPYTLWDMKVGRDVVPDGDYFYRIRTQAAHENAPEQEKLMPIRVDTVAPVLKNLHFDKDTKVLTFQMDDGTGIGNFGYLIHGIHKETGKPILLKRFIPIHQTGQKVRVDLALALNNRPVEEIAITTADLLSNRRIVTARLEDLSKSEPDLAHAEIILTSPKEMQTMKDPAGTLITGNIIGEVQVESIQVNGTEALFFRKDTSNIGNGAYTGPVHFFSGAPVLPEGLAEMKVVAKLKDGRELKVTRRVVADYNAPRLSATVHSFDPDTRKVHLSVTMADETGFMRLAADGNEVFTHNPSAPGLAVLTKEWTLDTLPGYEDITLKVTDVAGRETTLVVPLKSTNKPQRVERLHGNNRMETAVAVSQKTFKKAKTVVIASSKSFADALPGAPLAATLEAPVLLTQGKEALEEEVQEEIKRLEAKHAVLLGGDLRISQAIEQSLIAQGITVERLGGASRVETAQKIAERLAKETPYTTAFLVNQAAFADGITAGAAAALQGTPILYTLQAEISKETLAFLQDQKIQKINLVGGVGAVSEDVVKTLEEHEVQVTRLAGDTRHATSVEVAKTYFKEANRALLATGEVFADSLAASVMAAQFNAPVLLTQPKALPEDVKRHLKDRPILHLTILGGELSVSKAVADEAAGILDAK
ncbi:hypothetical protein ABB02_00970 [Clostridiaceae bacterium JG1575]|nr:hypothetical protein ABB02_00970 [Clostridiaceae bacterium JG1575]